MSPSALRRTLALSTAAVLALSAAPNAAAAVSGAHGAQSARVRLGERRIRRIELQQARLANDPHPRLIEHVRATRSAAEKLAGGGTELHNGAPYLEAVYMIVMRGHFTLNRVRRGARPPKGNVLTLIMPASGGPVFERGLGHRMPDLARLGHVTVDHRARHHHPFNRVGGPGNRQMRRLLLPQGIKVIDLTAREGARHTRLRRRVTAMPKVREILTMIERLPHPRRGTFHCPANTGRAPIIRLLLRRHAGSRPLERVHIDDGGCTSVVVRRRGQRPLRRGGARHATRRLHVVLGIAI